MRMTDDGFCVAEISDRPHVLSDKKVLAVCPFSGESENEDKVAAELFPAARSVHAQVGRHDACYAGWVSDPAAYDNSSSGGLARWILRRLLAEGLIDQVLQVYDRLAATSDDPMFGYDVASTPDEVAAGSKSAYYPVEMSAVIRHVQERPGRYAITGVPCFIKAVRALCRSDSVLRERIVFTLGVVCGHLKGKYYADMIGWQLGAHPQHLSSLDFRVKITGRKANEKGVRATSRNPGDDVSRPTTVQQLFGTNYGHGFFKYNACDYCDDVLAETADVAIGDAWLPEFLDRGTSLVVVRDATVSGLIQRGIERGDLVLQPLSADMAAKSQESGLRHRREGLSYRLWLKARRGAWHPPKRVPSSAVGIPIGYRIIYRTRLWMSQFSTVAFRWAVRRDSWSLFETAMRPLIFANSVGYRVLRVESRFRRLRAKIVSKAHIPVA
jgi:coenzyme F420-reducing hydrogenase beta subunit